MDALELVAFCAWCFAVALAGGLVGLVLGNIRLPVVLLAASTPAAGAGANIGISGVAALTAAATHVRAWRVNWRLVAWMAPPSMVGPSRAATCPARSPATSCSSSSAPCSSTSASSSCGHGQGRARPRAPAT